MQIEYEIETELEEVEDGFGVLIYVDFLDERREPENSWNLEQSEQLKQFRNLDEELGAQ